MPARCFSTRAAAALATLAGAALVAGACSGSVAPPEARLAESTAPAPASSPPTSARAPIEDASGPPSPSAAESGGPDRADAGTVAADAGAPATRAALEQPPACKRDADCGWDDPCTPAACGAAVAPPPGVRCGRPKTPGSCLCVAGSCALVRDERDRNALRVACFADKDCAFDAGHGVCTSGPPNFTPASGIACLCDTLNHRCVQSWMGEVPCRSFRDCSWQHVGGRPTHPVPSWFGPRTHPAPVRPCKDGEIDSICASGTCQLAAWPC